MAEADRRKWDRRYREQESMLREPTGFLRALDGLLPRRGRALDVAGGTGRHALWLARRGLDVTLADISGVALDRARREAEREALPLRVLAIDLEAGPLPPGPWDLILCIDFLWRPLFETIPVVLGPGGLLVVAHPTRSNLARHPRPGPEYLLDDGELPGLLQGLEVLRYEEGWTDECRHEARLVARRRLAGLDRGHPDRLAADAPEGVVVRPGADSHPGGPPPEGRGATVRDEVPRA